MGPQIIVNNSQYKTKKSMSLDLLLQELQEKHRFSSKSELKIQLNGVIINTYSKTPILVRPLTDTDHVEVNFKHTKEFLAEILTDLSNLIIAIEKRISNVQDPKQLNKIMDALNVLVQTTSYLFKSTDILKKVDVSLPVKELQIHMLSVMKAIETAHNKEDHFMLTDLLEYELKDNLAKWKILVIPKLKQSLKNSD